ncbi:hypothetical protein KR054_005698 [Drosophila jambulina]|nr:hypothetical protein KR054_005698 [Drosophila jambulina]
MNSSNLSSLADIGDDFSPRFKDSLDMAFPNFLNLYKRVCADDLSYEEVLNNAKTQWSKLTQEERMQFLLDNQKQTLNLKSAVVGDQLLEGLAPAAPASSESAFNNFVETFTIRLSQKAAKKWEAMSQRERDAYALREDLGSPSSDTMGSEPSSRLINDMYGLYGADCDHKMKARKSSCAKPVKKCAKKKVKRCSKPKMRCSKPKPRCAKPKPRCAKPKPKCRKPKPRCAKPKPKCG